ncbi:MAG: HAD family hydrolase [Akkermansiaceae bacterium]
MVRENIHRYENWIFDWSGTLVDDLTMVLDATNHVMQQYGLARMSREEFRHKFRLPYSGFYEEMLPDIPLAELEVHFRKGFADSEASGVTTPLLPHAVDFLDHLAATDKKMYILSSMDAEAFERHARELKVDHFFKASYAGILDKREQIHRMIDTHQLDPEQTVFLGDMEHDVETAKHGGVASIALLTGYQSAQQLEKASPDLLASDLSEVKSLLVKN